MSIPRTSTLIANLILSQPGKQTRVLMTPRRCRGRSLKNLSVRPAAAYIEDRETKTLAGRSPRNSALIRKFIQHSKLPDIFSAK